MKLALVVGQRANHSAPLLRATFQVMTSLEHGEEIAFVALECALAAWLFTSALPALVVSACVTRS